MKYQSLIVAAGFAVQAYSAACPYEEMRRSGLLSEADIAKVAAFKRDPEAVDTLLRAHKAEDRGIEDAPESQVIESRSVEALLDLPLGGGLKNGVLQPFHGSLKLVELPTPQAHGLKAIPGDDPDHQFQAPGPTDQRGVCPTLNTLANHGYISRDGISSFAELANAAQTVYGWGYNLAVFLSALGLMAGGDLPTGIISIGGADSRVPNTIGPALGLDSHGGFETDGSITRQDGYFGNNADFIMQRWQEYVKTSEAYGGVFNFAMNAEDNGNRYDYSRETNPQFDAGLTWFAVSHAERVFVYECLPNGTDRTPDYQNVAPFFLNETFPPNWFRRPTALSLMATFMAGGDMFMANPREPGGNEGLGNFVPLAGKNLTTQTPAEVGCLILEQILGNTPKDVVGAVADTYLSFAKGAIAPFFTNDGYFNCNVTAYMEPSDRAGVSPAGKASSGSPVNGAYPGIGTIAPGSEPS